MKTLRCAIFLIFICTIITVLFYSSIPVSALEISYESKGLITGFVIDENGSPVSNAIVTLWQDGQIWKQTNIVIGTSENPQKSVFLTKTITPFCLNIAKGTSCSAMFTPERIQSKQKKTDTEASPTCLSTIAKL